MYESVIEHLLRGEVVQLKDSRTGVAPTLDFNSELSTAPVLFVSESHGQLIPVMARRFKERGDIELALRCIDEADGVN